VGHSLTPLKSLDLSFLRAALRAMAEGIVLADSSGRIIYSNPAADQILGRPPSDGVPESWAEHYGVFLPGTKDPFPTEAYPLVRALSGEETSDVEMLIRNPAIPKGALISVAGRPIRGGNGVIQGAAVVFRDVTTLRKAEAELQEVLTDLRDLQDQKTELTAFLVHDMKGPLTTILANAELARFADLTPMERDLGTEEILGAGRTLHRMVLDLLDIQTGEDGRLEPHREPIHIGALMRSVTSGGSLLGYDVSIETTGPLQIMADPDLMRRVLGNLVDNCVKYGPPGGRIWLASEVDRDGTALLSVRDEGPGVPPDLREVIFEKYSRLERGSGRRRAGSRGLGLRFCRVAVEAHGGRIWVEDNVPSGACFRVELPGTEPSPEPGLEEGQ
jgi:signal transduction histidine kinase